ncbi:3964_t:CDS:2 [Paraglomus brasilianum]|uniref:3964_t:CDS:1 n=1 Tax=Paraglomus brasilianum TaxID=144538 RepID=A0A9N8W2A6_9GLOM|nr:3964_t:CDS:2 [Paraglomus brasilianum]
MASKPKADPAVATQQINRIKELSGQLTSQAFSVKMMGQNAKTYKADCVSFANRIQLTSERAANFAKKIEEDLPEVVAMKYDLEAATEELEKSNQIFLQIKMFIQQNQLPPFPNKVVNQAEDFRIQRLITDYNRRLDNCVGNISVAFASHKLQRSLTIEEEEEVLKTLKTDVEKELAKLEELKSLKQAGGDDAKSQWLRLAVEQQHLRFIPFDQIKVNNFLRRGGFGIVYQAQWDDTPIVLKQLFDQKDFVQEIRLHKRVHDGDYIVKLHGITKDNDGNLGMIMKYAAHGSLRDYLKSHASKLTWYQKVQLAKQITIGLSFIHRERIFHRDFHSGNILVDENGGPMITDFGLSRADQVVVPSGRSSESPVYGLVAYTAPERLKDSSLPFDEKCDIYSLGVVFWEIGSGQKPFKEQNDMSLGVNIIIGQREKFGKGVPLRYKELIEKCWHDNPKERPSMREIQQVLSDLLHDMKELGSENVSCLEEDEDDEFYVTAGLGSYKLTESKSEIDTSDELSGSSSTKYVNALEDLTENDDSYCK